MANTIKIKAGTGTPDTNDIVDRELAFDRSADKLYINDSGTIVDLSGSGASGDITSVVAGTGLSGGATSGEATLNIDSTVATLTGSQTLTNKTLASPTVTGNLIADSIDVSGDITLDADGADIILKDGGTEFGRLTQLIGGLTLKSGPSASNALIFSSDGSTMITGGSVQMSGGFVLDGNTITGVDDSGEFTDDDSHIMTSAAVNDRIESFGYITSDTTLSTEQVQDIVGAMFSSNTETRISATYQDGDGTIDLVVDDMTADNNTNQLTTFTLTADSGSNQTIAHGNTLDIAGGTGISTSVGSTDTVTVNLGNHSGDLITSGTVAAARIANLAASKITSGTFDAARIPTIDISSKTNLSAGTNISLSGDTLNVDDAFLKNNADDTTSGTITAGGFTTTGTVTAGASSNQIRLRTVSNASPIADTFSGNTEQSYIDFLESTSTNDPGYIMHETRDEAETNEGVIHLCPSDDNADGDYVSIHGTNDADTLKLHTSGKIEGVTTLVAQTLDISGNVDVDGTLETDALTINGTTSVAFTSSDHSKLDGIASGATANSGTVTSVATGGGLTGGTITGSGTISHADTSSQASSNNSGRTYIQDITLDTYGHVTGIATATETVTNTDTNTQLSNEQVQDIVGAMFSGNTETRISATYQDGDGTIDLVVDDMTADTNTQLSNEQVQDIVGAMFSGNTETRISATYQDGDGTIDLVVDDFVSAGDTVDFNNLTCDQIGVNVSANGTNGRIDAGNDIVAFSSSDKRLKENIKPLDNALDKVSKINGIEFDWKPLTKEEKKTIHGNEGHDVGVIAQEIEEVLPEVVQTRDTGYKAVKYEKIVPLLIEAIKELKEEIQEIKNG